MLCKVTKPAANWDKASLAVVTFLCAFQYSERQIHKYQWLLIVVGVQKWIVAGATTDLSSENADCHGNG